MRKQCLKKAQSLFLKVPYLVIFFTLLVTIACDKTEKQVAQNKSKEVIQKEEPSLPLRVGWQVAWATQGQLALILKNTDILKQEGFKGDFKPFNYGAPMSEAALAGQLDVAFVGDQPAINLLSRSMDWKVIARLMDFRVAIVIPTESSLSSVEDLKGKTLGIPFGSSAHRVALQMIQEAGLDPNKDLKILNIDITEQSDVVNSGAGKAWSGVDAFATWDHHIAVYEKKGLAKILKSGRALGVVMMPESYLKKHSKALESFREAFKKAYLYYATNQEQADAWFAEAAGGKFDLEILKKVAEIEPNLKATQISEIRVDIAEEHKTLLQDAADFAFEQGLIKQKLIVKYSILDN